ncbi:hypothetical protein Ddc_17120 [Ditylenchus destructor]|nr:hypothetical protein Ddc_17120 [Ditylenchus destructor]
MLHHHYLVPVSFLNQHGKSTHASTQRMHAEVNRAMLALAITPSISLIMPVFVVVLALAMSATLGPMAAFLSMSNSTPNRPLWLPLPKTGLDRPHRKMSNTSFLSAAAAAVKSMNDDERRSFLDGSMEFIV